VSIFTIKHSSFPSASHISVSIDAVEVRLRMIGYPSWNLTNIPSELAKAHHKTLYTPEDLKFVHQYMFLSSTQIREIFFGCVTRANLRLRSLWENDLLDRYYMRPLIFHGSPEVVYSLGKSGVEILAMELGIDRAVIAQSRDKNRALSSMFIEHVIDVNDFSLNFISLVHKHPDLRLERWVNERDAYDEYQVNENGKPIARHFRPDGYGRYWYMDKLYSFFLELDHSTEANSKFEDKIIRYLEYQASGGYQRKFGVSLFRVLVATTTPKRLNNLKKLASSFKSDIFWFTTIDNIRQKKMFQPIWLKSCNDGFFSLL
jgi:hypothetical protein